MIWIDLTEFLNNPIRSGVQRTVRKLILNWPAQVDANIIRYTGEDQTFWSVNPDVLRWALELSSNTFHEAESEQFSWARDYLSWDTEIVHPRKGDVLLMPELTFEGNRLRYYAKISAMGVRTCFIVYDLLPWLEPHIFNTRWGESLNHYLRTIGTGYSRAFISETVREQYETRVTRVRRQMDCALPLGADGLRIDKAVHPARRRCNLVCIGAFDGRKGQELILEAFLKKKRPGMKLIFAGRKPDFHMDKFDALFNCKNPKVQIVPDPSDEILGGLLNGARASIFTSSYEGYGLPAVESLFAGVPVIVNAGLPAVASLPSHGQIRLETSCVDSISNAMDRLDDEAFVAELRQDIARLQLPTWKEYSGNVAGWVQACEI